jgi:hypothetical protein
MTRSLLRAAAVVIALLTALVLSAAPANAATRSTTLSSSHETPAPSNCTTTTVMQFTTLVRTTACVTVTAAPDRCERVRGTMTCVSVATVGETIDIHYVAGSGCSMCVASDSRQGSRVTVYATTTASHGRGDAALWSVTSSNVSGSCTGYRYDLPSASLVPITEPLDYCFSG